MHTKGPWFNTGYDEGFIEVCNKPYGLGVIAKCYGDDRKANARLIAAAPELLEALEFAEKTIKGFLPELANSDAIKSIEAAINKARGETK